MRDTEILERTSTFGVDVKSRHQHNYTKEKFPRTFKTPEQIYKWHHVNIDDMFIVRG